MESSGTSCSALHSSSLNPDIAAPDPGIVIPSYARSKNTYVLSIHNDVHEISAHSQLRGVIHAPDTSAEVIYDTGSGICMVSKPFLKQHYPNVKRQRVSPFPIAGVGGKVLCKTMVSLPFFLLSTSGVPTNFIASCFVVDSLSCGMLLGNSFLRQHKLHIEWGAKTENDHLRLDDGRRFAVSCASRDRPGAAHIRPVNIYAAERVVLRPGQHGRVQLNVKRPPVTVEGYILEPRNFWDISDCAMASLPSGMMDGQAESMDMFVFGTAPIRIRKGQLLGKYVPNQITVNPHVFAIDDKYSIALSDLLGKDCPDEEPEDLQHPDGYPFHLPSEEEPPDFDKADISHHWGPEYHAQMKAVVKRYPRLFQAQLGRFNDGIEMPIDFVPNADLSKLAQRPYNSSRRDKAAMDTVLDPLSNVGVVESVPPNEPCPIATPAFIVWRNQKPRFVLDMRRVNTQMIKNAYPLPLQEEILSSLQGSIIFSIFDLVKGFFQQPIRKEDRWKTTFVTPHRGLERLTVSTMGLATSPSFFQHRMESMFRPYLWQFVMIYIDDIIVFSKDIQEHLQQVDLVLSVLEKSGCTLSLAKCHFAHHELNALGHFVSRLGLSTMKDKTEAISKLAMPTTLKELEQGLGLMGYYRRFIDHYSDIAEPLQQIKAMGFRRAPPKNPKRDNFAMKKMLPDSDKSEDLRYQELWMKAVKAWEELKGKLVAATELAHPDFTKPFELHVDGSKERGFGAGLHQKQADGAMRPVLFLSKALSSAEKNYGSTELETAALVWALKKLEHYLDHSKFIIVTDHTAIRDTFQSLGSDKPKGKFRLVSWRLYLERWRDQITIQYRQGPRHTNADALSRMAQVGERDPQPQVEAFPATTRRRSRLLQEESAKLPLMGESIASIPFPAEAFPRPSAPRTTPPVGSNVDSARATTGSRVETSWSISDDLKAKIVSALPTDKSFRKVYAKLLAPESEQSELLAFSVDQSTGLLYYFDGEFRRICLPLSVVDDVFKIIHDDRGHPGTSRSYDFLRPMVFVNGMKRHLATYVRCCPECQKAKPRRSRPFGALEPVPTPTIPWSTLCLDFITGLPVDNGFDCILAITDKFTKIIICLIGKLSWTSSEWAQVFVHQVYPLCGMPHRFVHDVDSRLVSRLWASLCETANVEVRTSAPHHQQANGQSERTVQTLVHSLRAVVGAKFDTGAWLEVLPHITFCINSSLNAVTGFSPYELCFGRKPLHFLNPDVTAQSVTVEDYGRLQRQRYQEAWDATQLATARMKISYDNRRVSPPGLHKDDLVYVKLAKRGQDGYHLDNQTKLSHRKVGPFPILEKISDLRYKIALPSYLKWRPEMSIEHLEPVVAGTRVALPPGGLHQEGTEKFIIDRILDVRGRRGHRQFKVRWLGYSEDHDSWEPEATLREDVPDLLKKYLSEHDT